MNSSPSDSTIPSFSIVIEAANLAHGNDELLFPCLESLDAQTLPPGRANQVLLMDPGHASNSYVESVINRFPWIQRIPVAAESSYFETKMQGVEHSTGEVILFADSDNTYTPAWIELMLEPFNKEEQVNVLVGETSVKILGLWSTVFALTFFFPPFSGTFTLVPADGWFGNNAAIRRSFLSNHPVPLAIPLLRGNDYIHSVLIRQAGHVVWRQNGAEALHQAPDTFRELLTRYLVRGSDRIEIGRYLNSQQDPNAGTGVFWRLIAPFRVAVENLVEFIVRLITVPARQPRALLYYPLAVPLGLILLAATLAGAAHAVVWRGELLRRYGPEHGGVPRYALG